MKLTTYQSASIMLLVTLSECIGSLCASIASEERGKVRVKALCSEYCQIQGDSLAIKVAMDIMEPQTKITLGKLQASIIKDSRKSDGSLMSDTELIGVFSKGFLDILATQDNAVKAYFPEVKPVTQKLAAKFYNGENIDALKELFEAVKKEMLNAYEVQEK